MHSHLRPAVIFGFNYEASCSHPWHTQCTVHAPTVPTKLQHSLAIHAAQEQSAAEGGAPQGRSSWFYSQILTTNTLFTLSSNTGQQPACFTAFFCFYASVVNNRQPEALRGPVIQLAVREGIPFEGVASRLSCFYQTAKQSIINNILATCTVPPWGFPSILNS